MWGNTVAIDSEVVDAPLDYNILLGRNWMYSIEAIASSLFRVVCFPFNGNIVMIIYHSQLATGIVGVGMYPSLMGNFSCPALVLMIGSSSSEASTSVRLVSFRMSHMEDPWILPTPNTSSEPIVTNMPFPATMVAYQDNLECVA